LGFSGCNATNSSKRKISKDQHCSTGEDKKVISREMETTLKALRDGDHTKGLKKWRVDVGLQPNIHSQWQH